MDVSKLIIIHSNDIHSRLENAAKIASIIETERQAAGQEHVLAIDIGDHMDRMRAETEGSDGLVNAELLSAAGYELVTLGNNEGLTYMPEVMERAYRGSGFQVLCANLKADATGDYPSWLQPSAIVEKGGFKIGMIAATANFHEFYTLIGWQSSEPLAAVREQVDKLREQVDIIAVMSHLGLSQDRRMAETIPGIDLIMGGHTHHLLEEPERIGGTIICAAGKHGEYAGRVEIERSTENGGRPVIRASVISTAAWEEQPEAAAVIARYQQSSFQRLSRVITRLEQPLPAELNAESPLANLLADGLLAWTDAEIGLVNTGQLLGGLAAGEVTAGQLHALCPSPINPCLLRLSGEDLLLALEQSLLPDFIEKPIKGFGFRGKLLGTLAVAGMEVACDLDQPPYSRIISVTVKGEPIRPERIYRVGTIDMFTFKVGYESLSRSDIRNYYLPEFIRDVLASQLLHPDRLEACRSKRWVSLSL
ncbi:bifunctional metallophosphatase/5'-nucleotidase [Paenibacillus protaetiae]|uniref:Bifunctional metallophosphatase/5'-nucleotidase n=1 Tax=Paenibacillus protaetiae TaxID=2509456 RepID=A0A4P6ERD7_9BACL|nr:bifunctional UDP-sugar hydrolase/5'-nucleotidase [Paenibacillus protaetiae]QAY65086.1 bifunctional metallophosphatase/5'-nucleotidase [Paenibacillus protaetiae]